eukprot:1153830-Pelagomonas_calceolata.AAC.1
MFVEEQQRQNPDDRWHLQLENPAIGQDFLLVVQTSEQRRMLELYGNVAVGMDSTYKTTMWGFPMFLLSVVDNHGHGFPVAMFIVQREDSSTIAQALKLIKQWSLNWNPKNFMVDKSKAEENAIAEAFGDGVKILLCDFHRLQAWWRYIIAGHNGVKKEYQAQLFCDLRAVADAMSFKELDSRLQHLKQSPAWKSNPKVRNRLDCGLVAIFAFLLILFVGIHLFCLQGNPKQRWGSALPEYNTCGVPLA